MKDLKLNDPVAILVNGGILFGVVSETMDRTARHGTSRSVMVEVPKEDPKHLKEDDIPERDGYLIKDEALIRKLDNTWRYTAPQELADIITSAFGYHWAIARSKELNEPMPATSSAVVQAPVGSPAVNLDPPF